MLKDNIKSVNIEVRKFTKPGSFHLNVKEIEPASREERESLVQMRRSVTYWKDAMRRFKKNKVAMLSLVVIILLLLFAFVGPLLSPYKYEQQIRGDERQWPSATHLFGTDKLGRDMLVRTMVGAQVSLMVGIFASIIVLVIGTIYGAISGYSGGKVDNIMMRIVEILYSVPDVLVIILLQISLSRLLDTLFPNSPLGSGLIAILITFALLYWVQMARMIRGQILVLKQQEYVTAARALGAKRTHIISRHLLPNCVGTIIVTTMFEIPTAIFAESFLSFIGLGVSAPMASLGSLASDALTGLQSYPYLLLIPAFFIILIILAFNQFGDGLRDALDPRMRN